MVHWLAIGHSQLLAGWLAAHTLLTIMKWVGIFQMGIFWSGISGWEFSRRDFDGWEFSRGEFSKNHLKRVQNFHEWIYFEKLITSAYSKSFNSSRFNPISQKFHEIIWEIIVFKTVCGMFFYRLRFVDNFTEKNRNIRPDVFFRGIPRNFAKFTGKHLCQSLFLNKVAGLRSETLLKERPWHRCFFSEFCENSKSTLFHRTPLVAASGRTTFWNHKTTKS